jgi:phospholipid/cholesterol/gamma-HCH transport system substrate-binding protein
MLSGPRRATRWVAVLALLVAAPACDLQTAGAPKGALTLYATFDDAQHLVSGHSVKVADVQVGTVIRISLVGHRARIRMSIADGHRIPRGTRAVIAQTSLLGENYVQLRFPAGFDPARGPFLEDDAEIADTAVDPSMEQVTEQAIDALAAIETADVAAIIDALATGLGGKGEKLRTLLDRLSSISATLAAERAQIAGIVDGFGRLGRDLAGHAGDIGALIGSLAGATRTLTEQRARFVDTLAAVTDLASALDEHLIDPHGDRLGQILTQLDPIAAALAANRATIGTLLANLAVLSSKAPHSADEAGAILIWGHLTALILPGGVQIPPASSGGAAVTRLLEPPR